MKEFKIYAFRCKGGATITKNWSQVAKIIFQIFLSLKYFTGSENRASLLGFPSDIGTQTCHDDDINIILKC